VTASVEKQRLGSDFARFWAGQTISQLGTSFTLFALPLLVFKLTGSAVNLAITTASEMLPYLLFGLFIGAYADRVNRKRMMIMVDVARAAVIATIPLLAIAGHLTVWWIYGAGFVGTTLTIFFESGQFAAIPSLVVTGDLVSANGKIQASYSAAAIAGPLIAGLLVGLGLHIYDVIWIDAGSFIVSAIALASIGKSFNAEEARERTTIRADVKEGLTYVLKHPVLRNISMMMAIINLLSITVFAQIVLFSKTRLAATDTQVALIFAAGSLGVVVLALFAGPLRKRYAFSTVALGALILDGLTIVALAFTRNIWVALPLWAFGSGLGILFNINTGSLRQALVPSHMLGRIITIASFLAWSAQPLGAMIGGYVIKWTGNVAAVYATIGASTAAVAGAFWLLSPLGRAEQYLETPPGPAAETEPSPARS
jgi:MFS family permease